MPATRVLTLYGKPGCHLCEELRAVIDGIQPELGFRVVEIDIRQDAELYGTYRNVIPVLLIDGVEVGRGRIDRSALLAALRV